MLTEGGKKTVTDNNIDNVCAEGDAYSLALSINYIDNSTGYTYIFTGDDYRLEGTCAQENDNN